MSSRYLIVQQFNFGDCLYATILAKQLKQDEPDCKIVWLISPRHKSILDNNPHVDFVEEQALPDRRNAFLREYKKFENRILRRSNEFDRIFFSQLYPVNLINFTGVMRNATLDLYNKPITVTKEPVIRLSPGEVEKVNLFSIKKKLSQYKKVVLFECAPNSSQSKNINVGFAINVAKEVRTQFKDVCFVISTPEKITSSEDFIIDASELSYRENAELTHFCTHFIGCSSGITWLATSDWAKKLPTILLLDPSYFIYMGVNYDFSINGINNDHVIEMIRYDVNKVKACLFDVFEKGILATKEKYNQDYRPSVKHIMPIAKKLFQYYHSISAVREFAKRYIETNNRRGNQMQYNNFLYFRFALMKIAYSNYFVKDKLKEVLKKILKKKINSII